MTMQSTHRDLWSSGIGCVCCLVGLSWSTVDDFSRARCEKQSTNLGRRQNAPAVPIAAVTAWSWVLLGVDWPMATLVRWITLHFRMSLQTLLTAVRTCIVDDTRTPRRAVARLVINRYDERHKLTLVFSLVLATIMIGRILENPIYSSIVLIILHMIFLSTLLATYQRH